MRHSINGPKDDRNTGKNWCLKQSGKGIRLGKKLIGVKDNKKLDDCWSFWTFELGKSIESLRLTVAHHQWRQTLPPPHTMQSMGKETLCGVTCENSWSQDPQPWWYLYFMFFAGSSSGTPLNKVLLSLEFSSPGLWFTSCFSLLPLALCLLPNTNKWNYNLSLNHVGTSFALALEWFTEIL